MTVLVQDHSQMALSAQKDITMLVRASNMVVECHSAGRDCTRTGSLTNGLASTKNGLASTKKPSPCWYVYAT